jgi:hypothetical protein
VSCRAAGVVEDTDAVDAVKRVCQLGEVRDGVLVFQHASAVDAVLKDDSKRFIKT